jgi:uncharacterized repeat protein (TIGR01451 family)
MVWKEGPNDYRMIYTGSGVGGLQVGYATSSDGISWTKYAGNPVFNDPTWANGNTENWGVIKVGSDYLMWYSDLSAPRESGIAVSTDLINWTPYTPGPIFATNGIPGDKRYSQYCPFTFKYGADYYALVPSYDSSSNYASYYLYRSASPYFPTGDRQLVRVAHTVAPDGAWDDHDNDTPAVLTLDIGRSQFYNDQLWTYYAAEGGDNRWKEGLLLETNIVSALADAPLPGSGLIWTVNGNVTVVDSPVRSGNQSVRLNDPSTTAVATLTGSFEPAERGAVGFWLRRDSTSNGDVDLYLYQGSTLAAVGGLGRNGKFHYWNGAFQDTTATWQVNTWYLVTLAFNAATDRYDFAVYDSALQEVVRVNHIAFGNSVVTIDKVTLYTSTSFAGNGYGDDFRLREYASPEPALQVGREQTMGDLTLSLSALPPEARVGESLTYTLVMTNNYILTATQVVVTDTLPGNVGLVSITPSQGDCVGTVCGLGSIASGNQASITLIVIPQVAGVVTNTATVGSTAFELTPDDNTASLATTVLVGEADLSIEIIAAPDPAIVSRYLTYTLEIANQGPSEADQVVVTDTLPGGVSLVSITPSQGDCVGAVCSLGPIASGNQASITLIVIPQVAGVVTNTATVGSTAFEPTPDDNTASLATTVLAAADLSIEMADAPDPVLVGQHLTYTLAIANQGPSEADQVVVTDTLPGGVSLVSITPSQGGCVGTVCSLGPIASANQASVTIVVIPQNAGIITNVAMANSATFELTPDNNTASITTTVLVTATDLSIDMVDAPDPVTAGQPLTYTLAVANHGPSDSPQASIVATLPDEVSIISIPASCGAVDQVVTCQVGALPANHSIQLTLLTQVDPATLTSLAAQAVVTTPYDPNSANNTATANTAIETLADVLIDLSEAPDPARPNIPLTYTILITNSGPSDAVGIEMTDMLPSQVTYLASDPQCVHASSQVVCNLGTISAGESAQITLTVQVNSNVTTGEYTNAVEVTADTEDPNGDNNTASETTLVDADRPLVSWISPVKDGQVFHTGIEVTLTARVTESIGIDRVMFFRWDHVNLVYVQICSVSQPSSPSLYECLLDPDVLYPGLNQIFVRAYDWAQNESERKRIDIVVQRLFLPLVLRQ